MVELKSDTMQHVADEYDHARTENTMDSKLDSESLRDDYAQFDLPLVEYARLHELTTDHTASNPFNSGFAPLPPVDWELDLEDSDLTNIGLLLSLSALDGHTVVEKLDIDKDSAAVLASVVKLGQDDDFFDGWQEDYAIRLNDLKLDEPILPTDPQLDLLRLESRNEARIQAAGMQLLAPEDIKEPAFMNAKRDAELREELKIRDHEKLDIDRATIDYLGEICKEVEDAYDEGDSADRIETLLSRRKTRFPSPETPPLLTSSSALNAAAPILEADEMELTSSPEDLIQQEAIRVEQEIMNDDCSPSYDPREPDQPGDVDVRMYDMPQTSNPNSSSPCQRKRLKDLKLEVPLTPEDSLEPPTKKSKTVSFSETIHTMIPTIDSDMAVSEPDLNDSELGDFIHDVVEPFAEAALKQIEGERLDVFDTTLRLAVPHIDDVALQVPWEVCLSDETNATLLESHRSLILLTEKMLDEREKKWSGVQRIERQLSWTPFPARLGKVDIEEELDDGSLAGYIAELELGADLDIEALLCPPTRSDENDDPIIEAGEPVDSDAEDSTNDESLREISLKAAQQVPVASVLPAPENTSNLPTARLDMQTLLKQRKLELEAANNKHVVPASVSNSTGRTDKIKMAAQTVAAKPTRFSDLSGGLANFLHHHGGIQSTNSSQMRTALQKQHTEAAPVMSSANNGKTRLGHQEPITLPAPNVGTTPNAFCLIVSPTVMADRNLMRELRRSFSAVEIVARDVLPPSSNQRTQIVNSEADITTSPSTGIITTTLQKLKQMPLPGQSPSFGVRERIALVSHRYSRLMVLVSEGRKQDNETGTATGPLDVRDVKAISDLIGFAASMESEVEVQFVAGGEPQLAAWTAASISRTATMDNSISLVQDESIWERTLREAGLNPFAAQYVLAKLKPEGPSYGAEATSTSGNSSTRNSSLAEFMQMTVSQRIEVFGDVVGHKVIASTSPALDSPFIPSARKHDA